MCGVEVLEAIVDGGFVVKGRVRGWLSYLQWQLCLFVCAHGCLHKT